MKSINQLFSDNNRIVQLLKCILLLSFLNLNVQTREAQYYIEGTIHLDSIWKPRLYLSHISDFSKMYTMSRSMIIAESEVDSSGHFSFNIDFLPKENNLYRIHVSKKESSAASIIIGGKDENHFFLLASKTSKIKIINNSSIFNNVTFISDNKNKIISKIDDIVRLIDSTNFSSTKIKSDFVTNAFNEQLRQIADTCSYPLVSLYALQKSKFEADIKNNTEFYQKLVDKWEAEDSVYFKNFRSKIPKKKNNFDYRILVGLGFILSFAMGYFLKDRLKNTNDSNSKLIKSLSVQERKIFESLKDGKSNKEISEEFNIGISTVKSHVSSIYSKLNIKSRREIVNFK